MDVKIQIGKVVFDQVNAVKIVEDIKKLANTATLHLPRAYQRANVSGEVFSLEKQNITDFIAVDDPVKIWLGYDQNLSLEFEGYVSSLSADAPLVIECMDEMQILKKTSYTKTFASVSLKDLIKYIAPGYPMELFGSVNLGKFTIANESAYRVLERLKKEYGIHAYFVDGVLNVGFIVDLKPQTAHKIHLNRNVRAKTSNLKFVRQKDLKLLVRYLSKNNLGEKLSGEFGEKGGNVKEFRVPELSQADLDSLAEKQYKSLSFDGFQGKLPTWGIPKIKAGDSIDLESPKHSEKSGKYLVEGVTTFFNESVGFKRENHLGIKL